MTYTAKAKISLKLCFYTLTALLVLCISLASCFNGNTYRSAKRKDERVLERNRAEMEDLAVRALDEKTDESGYFNEYYYSCDQEKGLVTFDIDAQGMLGGQYQSLIYSENGLLYGEEETFYFEEEDGNNIARAERIEENWWFYYIDYDGTDKIRQ